MLITQNIKKSSLSKFGSLFVSRLRQMSLVDADSDESIFCASGRGWDPQPTESVARIAVVGTRRPTSYGLRFVSAFIQELAEYQKLSGQSVCVVSGGALGIDGWAHLCAINHGLSTEAWVVGPIRSPNPRSHKELFQKILNQSGAVLCPEVLEPTAGRPNRKSDWVFRNAYLVARVDVVVVPESKESSGTWSSVKWANRMGIPVFAVPGDINQQTSKGANLMISSGYAHPAGGATKLMADLVVEGVLRPYNKVISPQRAQSIGGSLLESRLSEPGGLQVEDLAGLAAKMGLKLHELCEFLVSETQSGKLRRVGNGFERRS